MTEEKKDTSILVKIKKFFDYPTLSEFKKDWSELSDTDKDWFKTEIQKV